MITLKHLERFYPLAKGKFFYVLRDINLEVNEGDFVSIMGPSGAGKSSLLHVLGMHDHAWSGEYFFEDAAVHTLKPKERASLGTKRSGSFSRTIICSTTSPFTKTTTFRCRIAT